MSGLLGPAGYSEVVWFTADHVLSNISRLCLATVTEILELYIKSAGYFSTLVLKIDSYSVSIHVYTYGCMDGCKQAIFCCLVQLVKFVVISHERSKQWYSNW
jgi:hypothetical protein